MTCWTPAPESRAKNSSAVFPVKPMVQRRRCIMFRILGSFGRGAECKVLRLKNQGVTESGITAGDEQRSAGNVVEAVEDEEAILGVALGFEDATATNMGGRRAVVQERGADHQEAMALQGIFFGTHEGSDVGLGEGEGAIDAFGEIRGATARGVVNEPVFPVDARISGSAA